jgi:pullulanase
VGARSRANALNEGDGLSMRAIMNKVFSRASALPRSAATFVAVLMGIASLRPSYVSAQSTDALLAACNASQFATTIEPAKQKITDARAIWLSSSIIQWPKVNADASDQFALYFSRSGTLNAEKSKPVEGFDARIALVPRNGMLPTQPTERFKHLEAGELLNLTINEQFKLDDLLRGQLIIAREDASGRVLDVTMLQTPGAIDERYASAEQFNDYGATLRGKAIDFRLWAPTARTVHVCVYEGARANVKRVYAMQRDDQSGAWWHRIQATRGDTYYTYLVDVWVNGVGVVRNRVTDPYSQSLSADSKRSLAIDVNDATLKPAKWDRVNARHRVKYATDMSIYELHVRDFSMSDESVPQAMRGKYVGFKPTNSRGMQHLRALSKAGLTDVHLLPVFDIATIPEIGCVTPKIAGTAASESQQAVTVATKDRDCYNWGYDPYHFNAPEGSYATKADDGRVRVREFREMVQSLNNIGLRVGMDVVYNHMSTSGQNEKSVLDRIVPGYYHRLNAEGKIETSTCCDNTATEHRMMEKLMSDSVLMWARHYKIDSFRFDLMGHQPRAAMERMQVRLKKELGGEIQFLGEGWNFGEVENGKRFAQASQLSLNGTGIGTFTDRMRDAARGGGFGDNADALVRNQGYLNGLVYDPNESNAGVAKDEAAKKRLMRTADMIRVGLAGSIRDYAMTTFDDSVKRLEQIDYNGQPAGYVTQPSEVVNYVENHDNETLFDFNVYKMPLTSTREQRARAQVLGIALTTLAQGVAYFHAGIDILRSKSMDRNSYDSGDWFNRIDWTYRDNGFASGLPRKDDNGDKWPIIAPRLLNENIKPTQKEIEWTAKATRDLLAIRASSTLFRMRTAEDIKQRLKFFNVGASQVPTVIAAELEGTNYPGANFTRIVYLINVDTKTQTVSNSRFVNATLSLHPVQSTSAAADRSVATRSSFKSAEGRFELPPRSVSVFVSR